MKVLDPGHCYELVNLDDADKEVPPVLLYFVKREGDGYPGNVGHHAGTNLQEVMRALIDRLIYLDRQNHDYRNREIIRRLRDSIWDLEVRAAERHKREPVPVSLHVESIPVCSRCGHIGCGEACGPNEKPV